jgi:hypothetical protein
MADMPVSQSERYWQKEYKSLRDEYRDIVEKYPDAQGIIRQVSRVLSDIVSLAGCTPAYVGESRAWSSIVESTELDRIAFCKALKGKQLFNALYGTYSVALSDVKQVLQTSAKRTPAPEQQAHSTVTTGEDDGFKEQKRRKRQNSSEDEQQRKNVTTVEASHVVAPCQKAAQVPTRNFFAPLRAVNMETENVEAAPKPTDQSEEQGQHQTLTEAGRPPPIVLTSTVNLMSLQKDLKLSVKGHFKFRNTRAGTKVISKEMANYSAIRHYLDSKQLSYFTFFPKSEKPITAVIRHLLADTHTEDIPNALVDLGFDIINVKQMTSK